MYPKIVHRTIGDRKLRMYNTFIHAHIIYTCNSLPLDELLSSNQLLSSNYMYPKFADEAICQCVMRFLAKSRIKKCGMFGGRSVRLTSGNGDEWRLPWRNMSINNISTPHILLNLRRIFRNYKKSVNIRIELLYFSLNANAENSGRR